MSIFLTGGTGYLGSYVIDDLLRHTDHRLSLLVRATDRRHAIEKLWRAWQLHMDPEAFRDAFERVDIVYGDLHAPNLGIDPDTYDQLVHGIESVLHIAASLNRKSSKACFNTNLRGTLSVIKLARAAADHHGLRRFSHVSTVAVSGERDREVVTEENIIDWDRSDYDPYGRTKKFCEHMARELLDDVDLTFFRPSIVMGDSRRPMTSQFDMVRVFCHIADLPIVPFGPDLRMDIVNADWVGRAVSQLHTRDVSHDAYNLSSGLASHTAQEIAVALVEGTGRKPTRFAPSLESGFRGIIRGMNRLPRDHAAARVASLFKVFLPYITYDTVFDSSRAVTDLGESPTPFIDYCSGLYQWSKEQQFRYPYLDLPDAIAQELA